LSFFRYLKLRPILTFLVLRVLFSELFLTVVLDEFFLESLLLLQLVFISLDFCFYRVNPAFIFVLLLNRRPKFAARFAKRKEKRLV